MWLTRKEFGHVARNFHWLTPSSRICYFASTLRRLRYLPVGVRALGAAGLLAAGAAAGCGPIEYTNQVGSKAARAVQLAREAGAERHAPYEYTAAVAYLHKAREEGASAEYQIAIDYGRRAEDYATRASAIADEKGGAASARAASGGPPAAGDSR